MSYLRVRNWEKHQHRDLSAKGNMPWLKLDAGIFDDPTIAELTVSQFRAYILLLTLAARTGNKLPASRTWLRAHFGTNWAITLRELSNRNLLEGQLPSSKALQTDQTHRAVTAPTPRLEEKRGDKRPKDQPLPTTDLHVTDELEQRRATKRDGLEIGGKPGAGAIAKFLEELTERARSAGEGAS